MISEERVEAAVDYLRASAEEAAQARANMKYLAEFLKVKKAQIASARMKEPDTSAAKADMQALSDPTYAEILDGYRAAVEKDAFHSFKREAADATIRAWQTMCSNARVEGKAYS